jgi:aminoglycoside phosphotransferase family enzyme
VIFLAGQRAYKLKRAVRFPYMDFSTLALRRAAVPRNLFRKILSLIDDLRRRPAPA